MNTYIWPFIGRADDETIGNYVRALKGVLKIAADSGLIITIEPEAHDVSRDVAGLKKILAAVDHSAFKINYDPCNIYQGMEEAFPYAYFELREHIAYVHLKNGCIFREGIDPSGEKGTRFAPPWNGRYIRWGPIDQGALNVGQIIKQLVLDGYEGVVGLEPHTGNKAKRRMCFEREVAFVRRQVELARE
jgi:sugar phosphate isomerase/epimerase